MKKFAYSFIIILALFSSSIEAQTVPIVKKWEQVGPIDFTSAARQSASRIVLTTSHGYLYITDDNGKSFERQEVDDTLNLEDIAFADPLHGIILENGTFDLFTSDGGKTWSHQNDPASRPIRVAYPSVDTAYVIDTLGQIWHTIDRGKNWQLQWHDVVTMPHAIRFLDSRTGFALFDGGIFLKTSDAGEHWIRQNIGAGDSVNLYSMDLRGRDTILVGGWGYYYLTSDGGKTWSNHNMPAIGFSYLNISHFSGPNSFFALGPAGQVYNSEDFGKTMTVRLLDGATEVGSFIKAISIGDSGAIVVGNVAKIMLTENGRDWSIRAQCPVFSSPVSLHSSDGKTMQTAANGAEILISRDSGILWDIRFVKSPPQFGNGFLGPFFAVQFSSADTGFAYNSDFLYDGAMTTDGGNSWQYVNMNVRASRLFSVSFSANRNGFITNDTGVFSTTNCGLDWKQCLVPKTTQSPFADSKPWSVAFGNIFALDSLHAFLMVSVADTFLVQSGKSLKVSHYYSLFFRTNDAGGTWTKMENTPPVRFGGRIYFRTASVGYITADSGRLFRTTDGGTSWQILLKISENREFGAIRFYNEKIGFLGINTDTIFYTTNGGDNWSAQHIPSNRENPNGFGTNFIEFTDSNTIMLITNIGLFRGKISSGNSSVAMQKNINDKGGLSLSLFPNPVRDIVQCSVEGSSGAMMRNEIVDVLGRTVKIQNEMNMPIFQIDVRLLPAGVYTVHCESGNLSGLGRFVIEK